METALWNYRPGGTSTYHDYLDRDNFVDYQLAMELGHNVDAYRLSGKFFKRRDSEDPRFKMVVWDMNLAYGNADYYHGWRTDTWMYRNNKNASGDQLLIPFWWYKLNTDPTYTKALKTRWAQYRRGNLRQDRIMATIDSLAAVLTAGGAERRNSQAWPRWGRYVWPNYYVAANFTDEVAWLKQWLNDRITWMDQQLDFDPNALDPADVNGDGTVNIADVNLIINWILSGSTDPAGDVNGDGTINIADINAVINAILNH